MAEARVALVTGGGSGIGQAVAREAARRGWTVVVSGRRGDALAETVNSIGPQALAIPGDLAREGVPAGVIDRIGAELGRLDGIVHCAGHAHLTALPDADRDLLRGYMQVHVEAALELLALGWDMLAAAAPGRAVLMSSMSAHDPFAGLGIYGMAKAALEGLARTIASESDGAIEAWAVAPGCVDTPMLRGLVPDPDTYATLQAASPSALAGPCLDLLEGTASVASGSTLQQADLG